METRGNRIRRLREAKGMLPFDLQMASGVREQTIRSWESGRRAARDADLIRPVAQALGVTVDYILEAPNESDAVDEQGEQGVDQVHAQTVSAAKA